MAGEWSRADRAAVESAIADLEARRAVERMWAGDHTLWQDDPAECADRLGWLHVLDEMTATAPELASFADACAADGLTDAVVLGMGGSSLFPEVLSRAFPTGPGKLRVHVLDTTDPAAILRLDAELDPSSTLFVAASKSGSTIETTSQLAHEWERYADLADRAGHFAVITDPRSQLGALARERGFRNVFENRPDIGGRFSALSLFGLVPGALMGVDVLALVEQARRMAGRCRVLGADNPGVVLGAAMASCATRRRDKLTVARDPTMGTLGAWVEQLVAESTGKHDVGVLPIVDEPFTLTAAHGADRLFVTWDGAEPLPADQPGVDLGPVDGLGGLVFVFEVATALCGAALGINPFDQPDVAAAKAATAAVLESGLPQVELTPVPRALEAVGSGDYVAICAFIDPGSPTVAQLEATRLLIGSSRGVSTTLGLGPRFLHSTGQLHKGGANNGVFLQVVGHDPTDLAIPDQPFSFSRLKWAQAAGDLAVLRERDRRAHRVALDDLLAWRG